MEFLINQVSFSLPVKSFLIDYSVSQRRELPVVKEFVIRFLYSTEGCSQSQIADFFGFNDSEIHAVISNLDEEGLIAWNGDNIILSEYTVSKFENISGSLQPRFFEVQDVIESVNFDLVLYKVLYRDFMTFERSNLSLDIPLKNYNNVIDCVESAFAEQFSLFQEKNHDVDLYENPIELYKINSVTSQYDHIIPINIDFYVDSKNSDNVSMRYSSKVVDDWDSDKNLFDSIDQAISGNEKVNNIDFEQYLERLDDPFLPSLVDNGSIYIDDILQHYETEGNRWQSQKNHMIVGNLYTDNTLDIIDNFLKNEMSEDDNSYKKKLLPGALWFTTPNNKSWGKYNRFSDLVKVINNIFDGRNKNAKLTLCTPCNSHDEAYSIGRMYEQTGIRLQGCNSVFDSQNIEILVIPEILVISLYHFVTNDLRNLTVPVGYITTDKDKVKKVTQKLNRWLTNSKFNSYFDQYNKRQNASSLSTVDSVLGFYKKKKKRNKI